MIPYFANRVSVRLGAFVLAVFGLIGGCQSSSSSDDEKNPTQVTAAITIGQEWKAPDQVTWRTTGSAQPATLSGSGKNFTATIALLSPLANGDSVWVQLWTAGMKTAEVKYYQQAGAAELSNGRENRVDSVAMSLLEKLPFPSQRNRDTLLYVYAKALVDRDTLFKGFPGNCPTGIDTAKLLKAAIRYAVAKNQKLSDLSKTWLLAIDTSTVHDRVRLLVLDSVIRASDTLGMFPPPSIRVKVPVAVASAIEAGGAAVAVSGAFEWNAGLGLVAINSFVVQGADTLGAVAINGVPSIAPSELGVTLTGKAQILASPSAKLGLCSLVVLVRDGNGNAARSAASFQIKESSAPPQAPVLKLLDPKDQSAFPFDSSKITTRWKITSVSSQVDTVWIGNLLATKENDTVWFARVAIPATGLPSAISVRARNAQGLWGTAAANYIRATDLAPPTVVWISPSADTAVESDVTSFVARVRVSDPSGVKSVAFTGAAPDSVLGDGVFAKVVKLGGPGAVTQIAVSVADSANNVSESKRTVTRKPSNTLEIYSLPDSVVIWEDSAKSISFQTNCPTGATCTVQAASADTNLVKVDQSGSVAATTLKLSGKPDKSGRTQIQVVLATGTRQATKIVQLVVKPVNNAPTLSVKSGALASPLAPVRVTDWLVSVSAGPADESNQTVRYVAVADSSASLVSGAVTIDAKGVLSFQPKGISGTVRLSIVAIDNGDSIAPSANRSAPQWFRVRLDAPPTLKVADTLIGYEDQRTKTDTIRVDDLESPNDLVLDWTVLDTLLLPKANLRLTAIAGGFTFYAQSAKDSNGIARIAWNLTDPVGNVIRDTTRISFLPVNDAPVISKAPGLPDTIVISCLSRDTTLPKVFGNIEWEPGNSSQTGTFNISLVDTAQSHLFYIASGVDGILPLSDGRLRVVLKTDTDVVVEVRIQAQDNGGSAAGGQDFSARSIWLHLTDTVLDADRNSYRFKRMRDSKVWMRSNLYTKPKNGDTAYRCAGADLWVVGGRAHLDPDCNMRGALYNWGTAMNQPLGCDTSISCFQSIPPKAQGLCPKGWHVAEREEWSILMRSTYSMPTDGSSVDSTGNLRSATHDWGSQYSGWFEFPGTGANGDFIVPTDHPHGCQDRGAGSTNGTNFWLPHRPEGWISAYPFLVPGGVTFTLNMTSVRSDGICGDTDRGVASIRCVHD